MQMKIQASGQRQIIFRKKEHTYVLRYNAGDEARLTGVVFRMVCDERFNLGSSDAISITTKALDARGEYNGA